MVLALLIAGLVLLIAGPTALLVSNPGARAAAGAGALRPGNSAAPSGTIRSQETRRQPAQAAAASHVAEET